MPGQWEGRPSGATMETSGLRFGSNQVFAVCRGRGGWRLGFLHPFSCKEHLVVQGGHSGAAARVRGKRPLQSHQGPSLQGSASDAPSSSPHPRLSDAHQPLASDLRPSHSSPSPICAGKWLWAAGRCPLPRAPFHPPALWLCAHAPPLLLRAGNCRRTGMRAGQVLAPLRNSKMEPKPVWLSG
uniref:Uncharacterized protein n=1 Tax=Pipistrellus kuhlii TaxID=59472 RepID=A0A7J7UGE1_PIPKU|nr:hypothetical protein mPipKuh1_009127 [Pipistrellus kuhlii]